MIACPRCAHSFSLYDSFSIVNPFDFACPDCATSLSVGEKGEAAVWAAVLCGVVLGFWATYLVRIAQLPPEKGLGWISMVLIVIAMPCQWATLRYADVRLRDAKRDYDF